MTTHKLLVTALFLGWLVPSAAIAQTIASTQPTSSFNHAKTLANAKEVAVVGTIQKVVSKHGAGFHLLLNTENGTINSDLGPYVSEDVRQTLTSGQQVQVIGVSQTSGNHNCLLARQLVFSGRKVVIRNEHGFLVHPRSDTASRHHGQSELNGGN